MDSDDDVDAIDLTMFPDCLSGANISGNAAGANRGRQWGCCRYCALFGSVGFELHATRRQTCWVAGVSIKVS